MKIGCPFTLVPLLLFVANAAQAPGPHVGPSTITIGPNVQVSKQRPALYHGELWAAADPKHPGRLILGSMANDPANLKERSIAYVSQNGGTTWFPTLETAESVDPACAYGPDGSVYFLHLSRTEGGMEIFRSADGGKHWKGPVVTGAMDRPYINVNPRGILFINAHEPGPQDRRTRLFSLLTSAKGSAFNPVVTPDGKPALGVTPGNGVFLSDGTFAAVIENFTNLAALSPDARERIGEQLGWVGIVTSRDQGKHLDEPHRIADWYNAVGSFYLSNMPQLAVDSGPGQFRDRLYAVWPDTRTGRSEIYLSWSSDRGVTWSSPRRVNDDAPRATGPGPDHLQPAVAVTPNGVVGVSWYDRRDDPNNRGWRARFSASTDGGISFLPSTAVSTASYDPAKTKDASINEIIEKVTKNTGAVSRRPRWNFAFTGGDTAAIAAGPDNVFHIFWTDNRTGVPQVWTAAVSLK